ncbi:amidase [Nocardia sp. NPDC004711]
MGEQLWRKGAGELAALIRERAVSASEVVEAHLARIEEVNPELNAVTVVLTEEARDGARRADRAVAEGAELGPLHGVPVTIKENIDVAGTATTQGMAALAGAIAAQDAPVVERLRAAGAIVLGRTNMPDSGLRIATESSLRGITENPWRRGRTAGGSSGGEAAALASGMSPLGVGNDLGGSLRNPAHCCGISSLKPTTGRIPQATDLEPQDLPPSIQLMGVAGPMARTVADVRLGYGILSGAHPRDPISVPAPLHHPDAAQRVRVALIAEPPGGSTDSGIADAVRQAGAHLAAAGYEVEEVTPPEYEAVLDLWRRFLMTDVRIMWPGLAQILGQQGKDFVLAAFDEIPALDRDGYIGVLIQRQRLQRLWSEFFLDHPLILSPIWARPAFEHGWDVVDADHSSATLELLRPVMPANALGLPAVATTGGFADGMPVGVQLMAAAFREDRALAAAEALEAAVGVRTPIDPFSRGQ